MFKKEYLFIINKIKILLGKIENENITTNESSKLTGGKKKLSFESNNNHNNNKNRENRKNSIQKICQQYENNCSSNLSFQNFAKSSSFSYDSNKSFSLYVKENFDESVDILDFQPYKETEMANFQCFSKDLQNFLRDLANEGNLIIKLDVFKEILLNEFNEKLSLKGLIFEKFFEAAKEAKIFQIIKKKYGENIIYEYASMHLEVISIQSIIWAIKSLKVDKMTPLEKLVLSRIKEAFRIKITQINWRSIVKYLKKISVNDYWQVNFQNLPCFNIEIIKNEENDDKEIYILWVEKENWVIEDMGINLLFIHQD